MKKKALLIASLTKLIFSVLLLSSSVASASAELDRQYSLETVGILRSWDNVDGLFADYVTAAYKEYFSHESRFTLQDLSKADVLLANSKIPYNKLIEDDQILSQIARTMRSESIIRTKVYKEGGRYRFVVDWLHVPNIQLIASETFTLEDSTNGTIDFRVALEQAMERIVKKVPFLGNVTGRDNNSITVNIGGLAHLKKGDTLVLATLEDVKRHPLLKTIVDWRLVPTGRAVVDEIDEGMSFCKVTEEEYGHQVGRFQKIVQIIPAPEVNVQRQGQLEEEADRQKKYNEPPRLGFLSPGLFIGSYSRQASTTTGGTTGGGTIIGVKGEAQAWLTRDFFADLAYMFGSAGFTQKDSTNGNPTQATDASLNFSQLRLDIGYTLHLTPEFLGPRAFVKLGYQSTDYNLPLSTTEGTSPSNVGGFFIGIGGDLPIRDIYGALMTLDMGIFPSGDESGKLLDGGQGSTGASSVNFFLGGYAKLRPRMTLRVGVDVMSQSIDFASGASLTNKIIGFGPSLLFYF